MLIYKKNKKNLKYKDIKYNNFIDDYQILLLNKQKKKIGIFSKQEALKIASEKDLDIIQIKKIIKNNHTQVIAILNNYNDYVFILKKEQKKQNYNSKIKIKKILIKERISEHDLKYRISKIQHFLSKKYQVQILYKIWFFSTLTEKEHLSKIQDCILKYFDFNKLYKYELKILKNRSIKIFLYNR